MCGYPADLGALRAVCDEHGLALIEDAAQGFGVRGLGGGDVTCLSFFSKKQLALGEGGMVLTADAELAARVRLLRSHAMTSGTWDRHRGHEDSYEVVDVGFNFRLDEPRAALGLSRLKRVKGDIDARRAVVRAYRERIAELAHVTPLWDDVDAASHFAFAVLFESGDARRHARAVLAERGIQTTRYPVLHSLSEFVRYAAPGSLPNAEAAADRHLALPLSAHTTIEQVDRVVEALAAAR
jgi:dTDP-4-amino-4,6-dideoxygalactose transaminase